MVRILKVSTPNFWLLYANLSPSICSSRFRTARLILDDTAAHLARLGAGGVVARMQNQPPSPTSPETVYRYSHRIRNSLLHALGQRLSDRLGNNGVATGDVL